MLRQLKTYPILQGVRGRAPLDVEYLVDCICRVSHLMHTVRFISEIDLNPIMLRPDGISIVDSRIFFVSLHNRNAYP